MSAGWPIWGGVGGGGSIDTRQEYTAVLHFRSDSDEDAARIISALRVDSATYDVRRGYLANDAAWHEAPWVCGGGYGAVVAVRDAGEKP